MTVSALYPFGMGSGRWLTVDRSQARLNQRVRSLVPLNLVGLIVEHAGLSHAETKLSVPRRADWTSHDSNRALQIVTMGFTPGGMHIPATPSVTGRYIQRFVLLILE